VVTHLYPRCDQEKIERTSDIETEPDE